MRSSVVVGVWPVTTRGAPPPTSIGATVRASSSSKPSSTTSPSSVGPPSHSTRYSPRCASSASTAAGSTAIGSLVEASSTSACPCSRSRVATNDAVVVKTSGGVSVFVNSRLLRSSAPDAVTTAIGGISDWPRACRACRDAALNWAPE